MNINVIKAIYSNINSESEENQEYRNKIFSHYNFKDKSFKKEYEKIIKKLVLPIGYIIQNMDSDIIDLSGINTFEKKKELKYLETCIISISDLIFLLFKNKQSLKIGNGEFIIFKNWDKVADNNLLFNFYFIFDDFWKKYINYYNRQTHQLTSYYKLEFWYINRLFNTKSNIFLSFLKYLYNDIDNETVADNEFKQKILPKLYNFEIYNQLLSERNLLLEKHMKDGESHLTTNKASSKIRVDNRIIYFKNTYLTNPKDFNMPYAEGNIRLKLGKKFDPKLLKNFNFGKTTVEYYANSGLGVCKEIVDIPNINVIKQGEFNGESIKHSVKLQNCYGFINDMIIDKRLGIECSGSFTGNLHIKNLYFNYINYNNEPIIWLVRLEENKIKIDNLIINSDFNFDTSLTMGLGWAYNPAKAELNKNKLVIENIIYNGKDNNKRLNIHLKFNYNEKSIKINKVDKKIKKVVIVSPTGNKIIDN